VHTVHIIASEGADAGDARAAAENGIEAYGNGNAWDWYEVGGRWDGLIGATGTTEEDGLPGVTQLCYAENPELFNETINNAINGRTADLLEALQAIRGDVISADEVPCQFMGVPTKDRQGTAQAVSEQNAAYSAEWQKLLACNTADELEALVGGFHHHMMFYKVYKLMEGLLGHYSFDSRFYDVESGTIGREYVDERKGTDPSKQWITVFDLHN
jgi:hypothetical protein